MRSLTTFARPLDWIHVGPPSSAPAGESHHTPSLFPPPASTWQGALRTALLRAVPGLVLGPGADRDRIVGLVGPPDRLPSGWQMDGPWLAGRSEEGCTPWLPAPAWLLGETPDDGIPRWEIAALAERDEDADWSSGGPVGVDPAGWRPWSAADLRRPSPAPGWLSIQDLLRVLRGELAGVTVREIPPFVHRDVRPGVAVTKEGGPRRGMLYFLVAHRFEEGAGLFGGVTGPLSEEIPPDALHHGAAVIGRKHREVSLHAPPSMHAAWDLFTAGAHLPSALADGARVWVGLSTPALLLTEAERMRVGLPVDPVGGVTFTVRSTILGKDLIRGGLRLHGRGPPELIANQPWLPAGSGWLVEVSGGDAAGRARAVRALHHRCLVGPPELRAFGAGRLMVGVDPSFPAAPDPALPPSRG